MKALLRVAIVAGIGLLASGAQAQGTKGPDTAIGVVIMHGKGGSPLKNVDALASALQAKGAAVANLEMPWSGRREYDVSVKQAEQEVLASLQGLRDKGAKKVFVAGHSQGGIFALYFGSQHPVDGVIAIAPGGNVASPVFQEKLAEPMAKARELIAAGKGKEKARLMDFESSKGTFPVSTTPENYLDWFNADGAMNQVKASRGMKATPVLYVAPTRDYPGLQRVKQQMFQALPANPMSKMIEPSASHMEAPGAAAQDVWGWMQEVAAKAAAAQQ
jgi:pimeloyl-ACP methyl ester carboxylesterase